MGCSHHGMFSSEEKDDGVLECKESSIEITLPLNEDIAPLEEDTLCSHFIKGNQSQKGVEIGDMTHSQAP